MFGLEQRPKKNHGVRVGVLRGGPSGEYEVSLQTGASVLEHLPTNYHSYDVFIDKDGKWHWQGMEAPPHKILKHVDVVFNALHGEYGEDGKVQKLLENFKIPYTGSNSLSSALAMNKVLSRKIFEKEGINIPAGKSLRKEDVNYLKIFEIFNTMKKPLVLKPANAGSSLGVTITDSFEKFSEAIENALKYSPTVLIEEFIGGREATCGVIQKVSDGSFLALPPIEIRVKNSGFFDYSAKYNGETEEICPADFPESVSEKIKDISIKAHNALGLRHYSRADMIIGEGGEIYLLEINTLPGLTPESLLPKALKACDCSFPEFLDHLIKLALHKR